MSFFNGFPWAIYFGWKFVEWVIVLHMYALHNQSFFFGSWRATRVTPSKIDRLDHNNIANLIYMPSWKTPTKSPYSTSKKAYDIGI